MKVAQFLTPTPIQNFQTLILSETSVAPISEVCIAILLVLFVVGNYKV